METVLSGYCRTIDGSRMVLIEDGEADCDFDTCAYRDVCQIGQQIARLQEETEGTLGISACTARPAIRLTASIWTRPMILARVLPKTAIRSSTAAARRASWALRHAALRTRAERS